MLFYVPGKFQKLLSHLGNQNESKLSLSLIAFPSPSTWNRKVTRTKSQKFDTIINLHRLALQSVFFNLQTLLFLPFAQRWIFNASTIGFYKNEQSSTFFTLPTETTESDDRLVGANCTLHSVSCTDWIHPLFCPQLKVVFFISANRTIRYIFGWKFRLCIVTAPFWSNVCMYNIVSTV